MILIWKLLDSVKHIFSSELLEQKSNWSIALHYLTPCCYGTCGSKLKGSVSPRHQTKVLYNMEKKTWIWNSQNYREYIYLSN